jgi:hypothetical protein
MRKALATLGSRTAAQAAGLLLALGETRLVRDSADD